MPGARDEGLIYRRVLALQKHPVVVDRGHPFGTEVPERPATGVRRQDLANGQDGEVVLRGLRRIGGWQVEEIHRDPPTQKLCAQTHTEVELGVQIFEAVGDKKVARIHICILP